MFDVAIVGGGPAGSSTALHLVRACGIDASRIVILDRQKHPRDKPCGGAVSSWGLAALQKLGIACDVPLRPMRGVRLLEGDIEGITRADMGVIIRRDEFDARLLEIARADGVAVRDGDGLVDLTPTHDGWSIVTTHGTLDAKLVCACDGAGSTVRKRLGLHEPARKGHLYVTDTRPTSLDRRALEGLCEFDFTPVADGVEGYYWDFPTPKNGETWINRGIYHANLGQARGHEVKASLSRSLERRGIALKDVVLRPFSTRPLVPSTVFIHRNVLLVGEAAGIDRATGEGIAQAILYGEIAARHVSRALLGGDTRGYADELRASRLVRHLRQSAWLANHAFASRGESLRKLLLRSAHAREAGVRWYRGDALDFRTQARLGMQLLAELATGR